MAKEAVKEEKNVTKKKGRRLKKRVRKTLGSLFLISAILVATIPVDSPAKVEADADSLPALFDADYMSANYNNVPDLKGYKGEIYTTGDGDFQFAYVAPDGSESGPTKIAVILGFSNAGQLPGGSLTIPDTVDAYLNYHTSDGTGTGYVAVGKSGNYLFYRTVTEVLIPGDPFSTGDGADDSIDYIYNYYPCYYSSYSNWGGIDSDELYYYPTENFKPKDGVEPVAAHDEAYRRLKDVLVTYIGNQYIRPKAGADGGWEIVGDTGVTTGIFASRGNIVNLTVGDNMSGIGNYAFYGCTSLKSITLSNALNNIGNYAFAGCRNMNSISMDVSSNITAIGAHAFENCQGLKAFNVPINVQIIGDAAFKGCTDLEEVDLCGGGKNVALESMGNEMFVNCTNLKSITFPRNFVNRDKNFTPTNSYDIANFKGCTSMEKIAVGNVDMNITEGGNNSFGFEDFREPYKMNSESYEIAFYFEGPTNASNPSALHKTARDHLFAFSYLYENTLQPRNIYELTVSSDSDGSVSPGNAGAKKATYRVNSSNELISVELDDGIQTIDLPDTIGPYHIATIESKVFQDICSLKTLVIPPSVTTIASEAFIGCHHLEHVIFDDPSNLKIEDRAFQTQVVKLHQDSCDKAIASTPSLTFTGPVMPNPADYIASGGAGYYSVKSAPFQYAMDPQNKINTGSQKLTYITYYTGWPTNLTIRYNPETDKNELIDYPTIQDLKNGAYTKRDANDNYEYPYMKDDYKDAMEEFAANINSGDLTELSEEIKNSVINIILPDGIESVKEGLFLQKEDTTEKANLGTSFKTLKAYGLSEIPGDDDPEDKADTGCFANWTTLKSAEIYGDTVKVGDYAFKGCTNLAYVTLPDTVTEIGLIPFTKCPLLTEVNFQGSRHFNCDNSIIYQLDSAGNKYKVIECLEGRNAIKVEEADVSGVREVAPEAFSGTKVALVDLSSSLIGTIPREAFAGCSNLRTITLPATVNLIEDKAFTECPNMYCITVPNLYTKVRNAAFDTDYADPNRPDGLIFACDEDSLAYEYAVEYGFMTDTTGELVKYVVLFVDWDGTVLKTDQVSKGKSATPPADPSRYGYVFTGWVGDYTNVQRDLTIFASYNTEDPDARKVNAVFYDDDQTTVLYTVRVAVGDLVELPKDPVKSGYQFMGWIGGVDKPVVQDTNFYARFEPVDGRYLVRFIDWDNTVLSSQLVFPGEGPIEIKSPTRTGYTFSGWVPADHSVITKDTDIYAIYTNNETGETTGGTGTGTGGSGSGGSTGTGTGESEKKTKLYTLLVQNGSGSGSYAQGSQPIVVANEPASGKEFSHWTIDPEDTVMSSTVLSAAVITMPDKAVTVTAHYKDGSGKTTISSVSGNAINAASTTGKPAGNKGLVSSGTTVVINKNGLSNTGVVSATVNGSTDNFTIKISDSPEATEAVIKALQAEYGDISTLKYFPMDISLYDASGTTKITDTTGLTIGITMPIPDSLITYAGNNKIASVVSGRLDKMPARFTTIDGVACITFTAEHFSPYVIYVDTDKLTAGVYADPTPKTGDGIHPKWFLSLALAGFGVVLFMKRDKRSGQKVKTA